MGYSRIDSVGGPHHPNATMLGKRTGPEHCLCGLISNTDGIMFFDSLDNRV